MELTVLLPETDEEFQLEGQTAVEADVAGITLKREVELDDKRLHVFEELTLPGGELPASEIAAVRQLAAPLNADAPKLVAPRNIQRSWRFAGGGDREELDAIEQAYSDLIATDIDNLGLVTTRANFRYQTHDYEGAMEDYSEVIEFEPGVGAYRNRAGLLNHLGRYEEALQDAEAAWELDPSAAQVMLVAYSQAHSGDIDGALDFLDEQGVENGFASDLTETTAEIEAMAGRVDQALALLDGELGQSPDDANLLNSKCWLMGSWSYQVEEALPVCTKAVELAVWSPPVLDSRAMAYFRLGEYDKALSDIESALSVAPQQVPSLLLRGLIRRESGDKGGEQDIADALARQPSLKNQFAMFGFSI
jgi:tetratricopeptide (TPR) repeat protein